MDDKGGIQMLLAAEQDAQHIVSDARTAKTQRLRQARDEAEREVNAYKVQRDADFRKKQETSSGSSDSTGKKLDVDTQKKIEALTKEAHKVTTDVSSYLLKFVTTVNV